MAEFFAEEETERHLTAEQVMLLNKWAELTDEQKEILLKFFKQSLSRTFVCSFFFPGGRTARHP